MPAARRLPSIGLRAALGDAAGRAARVVQRLLYTPAPGIVSLTSGQTAEYEPLTALSTLARFPWVWVAVTAVAADVAGLPLVAVRGRGKQRQLVQDPGLDRLLAPSAGSDGPQLIEQLVVDRLLTGNAYIWAPGLGDGRVPQAVYRLHPARTKPIAGPMGTPAGYDCQDAGSGQRLVLPPGDVLHIRGVSWQDTATAIYGESPIRALEDDLSADLGARKTAAKLTRKGRPDMLFAVRGGISQQVAEELQSRWERVVSSLQGAMVVGDDVNAVPLSWNPKDFGELDRNTTLRDKVLAAFAVPPTKAGLTTANYGASRQEMRVYWETIRTRGRAWEAAFSRLARPGVRIEFDYTEVESLQVSYTERLLRVNAWVQLGATPKAAADYERFDEAPVPDEPLAAAAMIPPDRQPEEPQEERDDTSTARAVQDAIGVHLQAAQAALQGAGGDGETVDPSLLLAVLPRMLAAPLARQLEAARLPADQAGWWADELARGTLERWRIDADTAFRAELAGVLAVRVVRATRSESVA